ncbi:MAG: hypothetical protein KGL63_14765 [Betaproteobacteria bacterium]|nr:hypothetical protein [Betaproteobacteria bacterium]
MTFDFHNTTAFVGRKAVLVLTGLLTRFRAAPAQNTGCQQGLGSNHPATPGVYALLAGVPTDLKPH